MKEAIITLWGISVECPHCMERLLDEICTYTDCYDIHPGDTVICQNCGEKCVVGYEIDIDEFWEDKKPPSYTGPRVFDPAWERKQYDIAWWMDKLKRMDATNSRQYRDNFLERLLELDASPKQLEEARAY